MNSQWTRDSDGTWAREGWTIRRTHYSGSGQARPFAHVNQKALTAWTVQDPAGFLRTGSDSLANATDDYRLCSKCETIRAQS